MNPGERLALFLFSLMSNAEKLKVVASGPDHIGHNLQLAGMAPDVVTSALTELQALCTRYQQILAGGVR